MIQCPECRQFIPDDSAYCDQCGVELKWCPECKRPKRGMECPVCGNDLVAGRQYLALAPVSARAGSKPAAPLSPAGSPAGGNAPAWLEGNGWRLPLQDGSFGRIGGIWPQLSSCTYVSGTHGRVQCSPGRVEIVDVGSTNGTYLNGMRLNAGVPTGLKTGDRIRIASLDFIVK